MEKADLKASEYREEAAAVGPATRFHQFESSLPSSFRSKAVSILLCLLLALTFTITLLHRPKADSLVSCLANANIPHLARDSRSWAHSIHPWNTRCTFEPAAIATPENIDQIQAAVTCGIKNHVRVSAQGGGHSFGCYGLGGENGHLVIELSQMHEVTVYNDHTATIQPGARVGHISVELYNQARRAIPHGACPGVGLAGHVLHGGWGRAGRTHGLTLDWMIGAKVILANGSMVECSATKNADLFWALRGAGSSFGIVAEFIFDTFKAPEHVTPFTIKLPFNEEKAFAVLKELQDFAATASTDLNIFSFVTTSSQVIQGLFFGEEPALRQVLQPLLARLDAEISTVKTVGWLQGLETYADGLSLDQTTPYNEHAAYYSTSLVTPALDDHQIESLMSTMFANINNATARHTWDIFFEMHGGKMSAVTQVNNSATAYPHRDKMVLWQLSEVQSKGKMPEEAFSNLKHIMNSVTKLMPEGAWGRYANFIDTELDGKTAQHDYYAQNLPRLRAIKSQVDPHNVFWNPQGVQPLHHG